MGPGTLQQSRNTAVYPFLFRGANIWEILSVLLWPLKSLLVFPVHLFSEIITCSFSKTTPVDWAGLSWIGDLNYKVVRRWFYYSVKVEDHRFLDYCQPPILLFTYSSPILGQGGLSSWVMLCSFDLSVSSVWYYNVFSMRFWIVSCLLYLDWATRNCQHAVILTYANDNSIWLNLLLFVRLHTSFLFASPSSMYDLLVPSAPQWLYVLRNGITHS